MIDPKKITNYKQTTKQLEENILFWVCAAGKNAKTASRGLESLLSAWREKKSTSPFQVVRMIHMLNQLPEEMKKHGIGCYNAKAKTFAALAYSGLDLKKCTVDELEEIPGIGPKTARCFLIHSRENQPYAGLDTHVLKYMRDLGYPVPNSTPTGKKYKELEKKFLYLCEVAGIPVAVFDLKIWNAYSGNEGTPEDVLAIFNHRSVA